MDSIVRQFHLAFDQPAPKCPPLRPDPKVVRLRMKLIKEETAEVLAELQTLARDDGSDFDRINEIYQRLLKELSDLIYVVEGCAVSLGLPIKAAVAEVHRSNMSKLGEDGLPVKREDGKVLKGPNYSEADMASLVPPIIELNPEDYTS